MPRRILPWSRTPFVLLLLLFPFSSRAFAPPGSALLCRCLGLSFRPPPPGSRRRPPGAVYASMEAASSGSNIGAGEEGIMFGPHAVGGEQIFMRTGLTAAFVNLRFVCSRLLPCVVPDAMSSPFASSSRSFPHISMKNFIPSLPPFRILDCLLSLVHHFSLPLARISRRESISCPWADSLPRPFCQANRSWARLGGAAPPR